MILLVVCSTNNCLETSCPTFLPKAMRLQDHIDIFLCTWDLKRIWWPTPNVISEVEKTREGNFKRTEKSISLCWSNAWRTRSMLWLPIASCAFSNVISIYILYFVSCIFYICRTISPEQLRKLGRCPLTPEEAALLLSALGFNRGTYIYLAGSQIYGGKSRMQPFTSLYPNLVTKETLLTRSELEPFKNFSSQVN